MTRSLYRQPVLLDSVLHRHNKVGKLSDFSVAQHLHSSYLATAEFDQAALEYVIVFVADGVNGVAGVGAATGKTRVSPIVMLGVIAGENLFVEGARWDAHYLPAYVRRYPFWTIDLAGAPPESPGVMIDTGWSGWSDTVGDAVFDADGKPTPTLERALDFMRQFELEVQRTSQFCELLVDHDLLREMSADAKLPDGSAIAMNGFLAVDHVKLMALPDAAVLELHRNGILGLLHTHLMSLGNLHRLVDRKAKRMPVVAAVAAPAASVTSEVTAAVAAS